MNPLAESSSPLSLYPIPIYQSDLSCRLCLRLITVLSKKGLWFMILRKFFYQHENNSVRRLTAVLSLLILSHQKLSLFELSWSNLTKSGPQTINGPQIYFSILTLCVAKLIIIEIIRNVKFIDFDSGRRVRNFADPAFGTQSRAGKMARLFFNWQLWLKATKT